MYFTICTSIIGIRLQTITKTNVYHLGTIWIHKKHYSDKVFDMY